MARRQPAPSAAEPAAPTVGPKLGADAALSALQAWAQPMAQLALQAGLNHAQLEEIWRKALVQAATAQSRNVSQVSVSTGLHRKEVMRLQALLAAEAAGEAAAPKKRPWASQLILKWADWVSRAPHLAALPLLHEDAQTPCFAKLSRSVTTDVHPRAVLQELLRLNLVAEQGGEVRLLVAQFVPKGSADDALALLSDNVRDHLQTGLHNIAAEPPAANPARNAAQFAADDTRWIEQAIWAEGISLSSARQLNHHAREAWAQAYRALYKQLLDTPEAPPGEPRYRVRVGLYMAAEPTPELPNPPDA